MIGPIQANVSEEKNPAWYSGQTSRSLGIGGFDLHFSGFSLLYHFLGTFSLGGGSVEMFDWNVEAVIALVTSGLEDVTLSFESWNFSGSSERDAENDDDS